MQKEKGKGRWWKYSLFNFSGPEYVNPELNRKWWNSHDIVLKPLYFFLIRLTEVYFLKKSSHFSHKLAWYLNSRAIDHQFDRHHFPYHKLDQTKFSCPWRLVINEFTHTVSSLEFTICFFQKWQELSELSRADTNAATVVTNVCVLQGLRLLGRSVCWRGVAVLYLGYFSKDMFWCMFYFIMFYYLFILYYYFDRYFPNETAFRY